jgi:hypothetical protein
MCTVSKRNPILLLAVLVVASLAMTLAPMSAGAATQIPRVSTPVIHISAGQGNGVLVLNALADKVKIPYDYSDIATSKHIAAGVGLPTFVEGEGAHKEIKSTAAPGTPYKTMILVMGASLKGMGASGLSLNSEIARLKDLINYCKANKIFVVGMHVEGVAMRGKPGSDNEAIIDAVAPLCDYLIVTTKGYEYDDKFANISSSKGIPISVAANNTELMNILKTMFGLN